MYETQGRLAESEAVRLSVYEAAPPWAGTGQQQDITAARVHGGVLRKVGKPDKAARVAGEAAGKPAAPASVK